MADLKFFNRAVEFAKENNIAICHDGPYTEVAYDGYRPVSFLQAPKVRGKLELSFTRSQKATI